MCPPGPPAWAEYCLFLIMPRHPTNSSDRCSVVYLCMCSLRKKTPQPSQNSPFFADLPSKTAKSNGFQKISLSIYIIFLIPSGESLQKMFWKKKCGNMVLTLFLALLSAKLLQKPSKPTESVHAPIWTNKKPWKGLNFLCRVQKLLLGPHITTFFFSKHLL